MKTTFTARHFEPSTELHRYCEETVEKLDHFFDRIITCDIILQPSADDEDPFQAELNVKVPQKLINASARAGSYEEAVSEVMDNVSRQLKKYKQKNFANR